MKKREKELLMAGKTPMMRQYNEIKKQYPNAILFLSLIHILILHNYDRLVLQASGDFHVADLHLLLY